MLTHDQQLRIVRAVSLALCDFTSPAVAEERARNLATALMFDDVDSRREVIAGVLLTCKHDIRQFWDAVDGVIVAVGCAIQESNGDRFALLVRCGMRAESASEYLRANGWTATGGEAVCA